MSGELIRTVTSGDNPICPMDMGRAAGNTAHRTWNMMVDLLYGAMKEFRNEEDEYADPNMEKIYSAVAYNGAYKHMQLHRESSSFVKPGGTLGWVETYYYRCHLCGFVLPLGPEVKR